jgi:hypothetical protein
VLVLLIVPPFALITLAVVALGRQGHSTGRNGHPTLGRRRPRRPDYSKRITVMTTAIDVRVHLLELQAERALATIEGVAVNSAYTADLDGEIEATPWWRRILQRPSR